MKNASRDLVVGNLLTSQAVIIMPHSTEKGRMEKWKSLSAKMNF